MQMTDSTYSRKNSLVKIGGAIGMAGSFIALGIFLFALLGFYAVFMLSVLPVALGTIGLVITIFDSVRHKYEGEAETQPISALFACATAIIVGLIMMQIWLTWPHPAA